MKNLLLLLSLAALSLASSSCCSMFGMKNLFSGSYTETYKAKTCGYDIVRTEKVVDAKSGLVEVTEEKVPRYKEKTRRVFVKCPSCTRFYCLKEGCCGSSTEAARKMATAQGPTGSPHVGLIPTMKSIVP
ncbi:MAG: hypothetical protein MUF31_13170 [Akkermansiaceae bacterium]|jgi:hypothetical protein|nr:hypothetical protein [Akkermansiaceae bacterium]